MCSQKVLQIIITLVTTTLSKINLGSKISLFDSKDFVYVSDIKKTPRYSKTNYPRKDEMTSQRKNASYHDLLE